MNGPQKLGNMNTKTVQLYARIESDPLHLFSGYIFLLKKEVALGNILAGELIRVYCYY